LIRDQKKQRNRDVDDANNAEDMKDNESEDAEPEETGSENPMIGLRRGPEGLCKVLIG